MDDIEELKEAYRKFNNELARLHRNLLIALGMLVVFGIIAILILL